MRSMTYPVLSPLLVLLLSMSSLLCDSINYYSSSRNGNKDVNRGADGARTQCDSCCRGLPGPQGVPGHSGLHGARGQDGTRGDRGDKGDAGQKGDMGLRGEVGQIGPKGRRGRKGSLGETGPLGPQGPKGDIGPIGNKGSKGDTGKRGPKGEQPARIAFTVTRSEPLGPVPQETPIVFDKVRTNLGDSFDKYSSHFICKVNGTYFFAVHVLSMENQTAYGWLMLNNAHEVAFRGDATAKHGTGSNTVILRLVKDDHVWVQLNTNSAIINDFSSFSGHILFED